MKILEHRALPGPNRYSPYPTIHMVLDLGDLADTSSSDIPGFAAALEKWVPSLREHRCSPEKPGGFLSRLQEGTLLGHVIEHLAIELQCLAGMHVGFGKTRRTATPGRVVVAYRYRVEEAGLEAGWMAVDVVSNVLAGNPTPLAPLVARLRRLGARERLGPSTQAIVREARRRGIPTTRLDDANYVQLGQGVRQRRIQASLTSRTSCIAAEIADDKDRTKRILAENGIPVPRGEVVATLEEAVASAQAMGFPVVVKPLVGNHGRGVSTHVRDLTRLRAAFEEARQIHRLVIVEEWLRGADFRVLVVNHRFVAAARREPASVTGDGRHTIEQLVARVNQDPRRGEAHDNVLTRIELDEHSLELLRRMGLTPHSVPPAETVVVLKGTANLSTGATATDVTAEVHPQVRRACERASRCIGLDIMGLDIVAPDLRQPLQGPGRGVVEVNAAPGLRMHLQPSHGHARNVGAAIIDSLFPHRQDGRIPVVAVTGTNGKTTTVRLIGHVLRTHGAAVGLATTSGIEIDGDVATTGDYSGPEGARIVLGDPLVDHAVLEVARGGILRRGLGFDTCDVGVFLNVANDHLGDGDIETLDDLADLKAVVVESVARSGTAVLNADDDRVHAYRGRLRSRVTLTSMDSQSPRIAEHVQRSGRAVTVVGTSIVVRDLTGDEWVGNVHDFPITLGGTARFNTQNILAAVAACHALGVPSDVVRKALESFQATPEQLPGRLNLIDMDGYRVLVDYGHNVPALRALEPVIRSLGPDRVVAMCNASGNRRDEDLRAFGEAIAGMYDPIVLCDPDPRNRPPGETVRLVREGILAAGMREEHVEVAQTEASAIQQALKLARPGDLVVLQVDNVEGALAIVDEWRLGHGPGRPPRPSRPRGEPVQETAWPTRGGVLPPIDPANQR